MRAVLTTFAVGLLLASRVMAAEFTEWTGPVDTLASLPYPMLDEKGGLRPYIASLPLTSNDKRVIRMEGPVEPGDDERLRAAAGRTDPYGNTILWMNSDGGNFEAGLALGDAITELHLMTFVGPGQRCLSACAFAFLAGQAQIDEQGRTTPTRQLHTEGILGFHAPSLAGSISVEMLADPTTTAILTQEFARPTMANIAELQRRAAPWMLSSDMLASILQHVGSDDFITINRVYEAMQNEITVIGPPQLPVKGWGAVEAFQACSLVLGRTLWAERPDLVIPAFGGGWQEWMPGAAFFRNVLADRSLTVTETAAGPVFVWKTVAGRIGEVTCTVQQGAEGPAVLLAGAGLPEWDETVKYLKTKGAIPVSRLGLLGFGVPWTAVGAADLYIEDPDGLWANVPGDVLAQASLHDPCRNAAQVWPTICRFPILRKAIGVMTGLSDRLNARQDYRDTWNQNIALLCRPQALPAGDAEAEMFGGYCSLMVTSDLIRIALASLGKTP
ncbi:MAG: hypothetical protein DI533_11670 [Cereibacter sphaeroides]|uniref:Uncharacterized protein n=1 Tax=Cereibacter sphaeroides TaxID=1063 RepID=A0A2W5UIT5_CERSP|nr:MAG: hypothetical protein DI533_11670 [Cereibacter sphaeroides]